MFSSFNSNLDLSTKVLLDLLDRACFKVLDDRLFVFKLETKTFVKSDLLIKKNKILLMIAHKVFDDLCQCVAHLIVILKDYS